MTNLTNAPRTVVKSMLLTMLAVGIVVAYANTAIPVAHGQIGPLVCPSNKIVFPCASCPGNYQCLPYDDGYRWGTCIGGEVTCAQVLSPCVKYTCTVPPKMTTGSGCASVPPKSYSACQ